MFARVLAGRLITPMGIDQFALLGVPSNRSGPVVGSEGCSSPGSVLIRR